MKTTKNIFPRLFHKILTVSATSILLFGISPINSLYAICPGKIKITGQTIICAGNSTNIQAFGEYIMGTYNWFDVSTNTKVASGTSVVFNPSTTTTYMVTVRDTTSCIYSEYVTITVKIIPNASLSVPTSAKVGEKITAVIVCGSNTCTYTKPPLNNVGGTGFQGGFAEWGNVISAGYFTLKATNSNGCSKTIASYLNVVK